MPFKKFDRSKLILKSLSEREHDLTLDVMFDINGEIPKFDHPSIDILADRIIKAREKVIID